MPSALHPQAQFVPISPEFDLHALVTNTSNFDYVTRLSTEKLKEHSIQSFEALVLAVVIQGGKPLVIEGWGDSLPPWLYSSAWIEENLGTKPEQVRDIPNEVNIPMTTGHYLRSMEKLTDRITKSTYRDPKRQRLYLKDIDTPEAWANHLKEIMPESVFYLNECIEPRTGGDGAIREPNEYGQMVYGKGVAPAGDLMSSLPPEMRAMNMMCYIGHEGTFTPAHREMCASLGHNIMVEASENRKGEKPGSSIWFMTETKEREVVSEYFLSMLGHDIEVEKHFAQLNAWKKAPFNVWIVEQKVGDLILIPPLAPHQVWNRGTRTMKAAWNRTTVDTLELALHEALPRARMVCREEQYKNKAIVYYTLLKYHDLLLRDTVEPKMWKYGRIKQVLEDFKRLFALYTEILVSEMFSPKLPEETDVEFLTFDSNVTCSYCRGNIFNRFLTCKSCIQTTPDGEEDTYDICMDCYAMGRSCACISNLNWVEQWPFPTLVENYELWRGTVVQFDGFFDVMRSPQPLDIARKRYGRKPVAEVCQEQLKERPWTDITKPVERELTPMSEEEPEVDDEGRIKKKKRKKTRATRGKFLAVKNRTHTCHICCYHDWNWKLAFCSSCNLAYCYGVLWRAFDLMPQTVMEDKEWACPRCLKICSCGKCRKDPRQTPYAPKGTLLGHDTRKVADYRSVESLVDFSRTNLAWLRGENETDPHESSRMKKLKEKAEAEKSRVENVDDSYLNGMEQTVFGIEGGQTGENHDIDPMLLEPAGLHDSNGQLNGHHRNQYENMDGTTNHEGQISAPSMENSLNVDWMVNDDVHYEFEDFDPGNSSGANQHEGQTQGQASYPSRLLAPTVPEPFYPDPANVGPNRMMGAGFYQQGSGVDRILFDPPDIGGSSQEVYKELEVPNPNFAFSDLLDPALQPQDAKKRRRKGEDGFEDEEEFFTSKRQKRLAKAMKPRQENDFDNIVTTEARSSQRQPRRSTGKTSYVELGEEDVPIEEDEGPPNGHGRPSMRKAKAPLTDLELAAEALSRLGKPETGAPQIRRPGRPRRVDTNTRQSASPASNTIKTPRRSAWLSRRDAADTDTVLPSELPKRTRRQPGSLQSMQTPSAAVDISPTSDVGDRTRIQAETDSLFGEPIETDESDDGGVALGLSDEEPVGNKLAPKSSATSIEIQAIRKPGTLTADTDANENQNPAPKRRGRPRKTPLPPMELNSKPPVMSADPASATRFLSLKEKLAGKTFKIVSKTQSAAISPSVRPSVQIEQRVSPKPTLRPSEIRPERNNGNNTLKGKDPSAPSSFRPLPKSAELGSPLNHGPTVVRLTSPSTEQESASIRSRSDSFSSTDDYSDSIASIPAVRVPPSQARRGATSMR